MQHVPNCVRPTLFPIRRRVHSPMQPEVALTLVKPVVQVVAAAAKLSPSSRSISTCTTP